MKHTRHVRFQSKMPSRRRSERPQLEVLEDRTVPSNFSVGPLVQVSLDDPFAGCTADDPAHQPGRLYPDSELEPRVTVDPNDPTHIIGMWQQDRWSDGAARGLVAGVTFDGGQDWQEVVIPGLSRCSGGSTLRVSDPWVSFSPDGSVYSTSLSTDGLSARSAVLVNKSTDGGLTWSDPLTLIDDSNPRFFNDKETITADPTDSNYAYVLWDRIGGTGGRPEMFSRTTDGGQTWEAPRPIFFGGRIDSHIVVLPDGTLVDLINGDGLFAMRSTDKGETWGSAVQIAISQAIQVRDPDTGQSVRTSAGTILDAAVDPNSGNLYVVWEDARFSGRQHNSIAFTMSSDGGFTWSQPVQVNQTPADIPPGDQQAFDPSVQVAADGTVGVSYYDFRFNDPQPGLLTDYWFVPGTPNDSGGIDWGNEVQLTDQSFNLEIAPNANGLFLGDYQGLGAAGNSFVAFFGQTHDTDPGSIFFRSIDPTGNAPGCGICGGPGANIFLQDIKGAAEGNLAALWASAAVIIPGLETPIQSAAMLPDGAVTAPLNGAHINHINTAHNTEDAAWSNLLALL
jgi:hypothetical protein